jgi:hypothetical protein
VSRRQRAGHEEGTGYAEVGSRRVRDPGLGGLGSPAEDHDGGFEYGGWSAPYGDEVPDKGAGQGLAATTAYLFGRKTHQKLAA